MGFENFCKTWHVAKNIGFKVHLKHGSRIKVVNKKSHILTLFLELNTKRFSSNPQNQTCRANYKENNKIGLAFFWFFYNFLEFFKVHHIK